MESSACRGERRAAAVVRSQRGRRLPDFGSKFDYDARRVASRALLLLLLVVGCSRANPLFDEDSAEAGGEGNVASTASIDPATSSVTVGSSGTEGGSANDSAASEGTQNGATTFATGENTSEGDESTLGFNITGTTADDTTSSESDSETTGGVGLCRPVQQPDCAACIATSCCVEFLACTEDEVCDCVATCVGEGNGIDLCLEPCEADEPPVGLDALGACVHSMCTQADECPAA